MEFSPTTSPSPLFTPPSTPSGGPLPPGHGGHGPASLLVAPLHNAFLPRGFRRTVLCPLRPGQASFQGFSWGSPTSPTPEPWTCRWPGSEGIRPRFYSSGVWSPPEPQSPVPGGGWGA